MHRDEHRPDRHSDRIEERELGDEDVAGDERDPARRPLRDSGPPPYGPGHWAWRDDPRRHFPDASERWGGGEPRRGQADRPDNDREPDRGEGRYAGRGPASYRRPDEWIEDDVNVRLTEHPQIDATDVDVRVENGVVVLRGEVPTDGMRRAAEAVAEHTIGVRDVLNELRVESRGRLREDLRVVRPDESPARRLETGMVVCDVNGDRVGKVKRILRDAFHMDRPRRRGVAVPLRAVREVIGDQVLLRYRAEDIDDMGWDLPEPVGSRRDRER